MAVWGLHPRSSKTALMLACIVAFPSFLSLGLFYFSWKGYKVKRLKNVIYSFFGFHVLQKLWSEIFGFIWFLKSEYCPLLPKFYMWDCLILITGKISWYSPGWSFKFSILVFPPFPSLLLPADWRIYIAPSWHFENLFSHPETLAKLRKLGVRR